jgi:ATP-dependent Clp protease protease subunit
MYHDPTYIDIVMAYSFDVRRRRFVLHGSIDHEDEHGKNPITHAVGALLYLDQSAGDIEFWICTPGGDSAEMFGLYDVIRRCKNKVHTIGFGKIYSAGVLLLVAGDRRSVLENSTLMSHSEVSGADPCLPVWTGRLTIEAQLRMERRWAHLMAQRTRKSFKYWFDVHQGRKTELWLDADEMLEYGIVDEVIRDSLVE